MIIAASLALIAVPAGPDAAPVVAALARVYPAIDYAGACAATPEEEESYQLLHARDVEISDEAQALFGPLAGPIFEAAYNRQEDRPHGCGAGAAALIREAPARLDAAAAALAQQVARMPGVWLGTMRVCGATISRPEPALVDFGDAFILTLPPELHGRLAEESRARVDLPMAVRIDGRQIAAPIVSEPITGGALQLSGGSPEEVANLRAALDRPC